MSRYQTAWDYTMSFGLIVVGINRRRDQCPVLNVIVLKYRGIKCHHNQIRDLAQFYTNPDFKRFLFDKPLKVWSFALIKQHPPTHPSILTTVDIFR